MSTAVVNKNISNKLLKKLNAESVRTTRKSAQTNRPQVLRLIDLNFINDTLNSLVSRNKAGKTLKLVEQGTLDAVLPQARALGKKAQDNFIIAARREAQGKLTINKIQDTTQYQRLSEHRKDLASEIDNGQSFIVGSFSAIGDIKGQIVDIALKGKSKELIQRVKAKVDRGHGTSGGDAISSLVIAGAASYAATQGIELGKTPGLKKYLIERFSSNELIDNPKEYAAIVKQIIVSYQSLVDKNGNLKASYIPSITFQDFYANRGIDSAIEKFTLNVIRDFVSENANEFVTQKGSKSIKDKIETHIVNSIVIGLPKSKNIRVKRAMSSSMEGGKKSAKGNKKSIKPARVKTVKPTQSVFSIKQETKAEESYVSLAAILNKRINEVVRKNMRPPDSLENRTGRFADSVRIENVVPTKQGFPSIGYSYMKYPYQTFERGYKQGNLDLDPRDLIEASIREIALELTIGRFYTRRV